jgi:3-deoxy-D-manno-octulosonate 8-phosphate phosphatase (KDO 8-P phosphatase)
MTDGGLLPVDRAGETLKRFTSWTAGPQAAAARRHHAGGHHRPRFQAAARKRLEALGVDHVHYGTEDKRRRPKDAGALGLDWSQAAAMGDDWPDLPVLRRCALRGGAAQCAHRGEGACARYVTQAAAGHGAAREFCDLLLVASGRYALLELLEARLPVTGGAGCAPPGTGSPSTCRSS